MFDYEEVCPISKAASVLCERWTLQILREMFFGASRFSELQTYLPRLSPSLLNKRLRDLEQCGIVLRRRIPEKRGFEYQLTPTGRELRPVLTAMGRWGMKWAFGQMNEEELNLSTIVRDFAVALKLDELPAGDSTIQFNVTSGDATIRKFILVRDGAPQVCDENIGFDVNIYLTASLLTLGRIWFGELSVTSAREQGLLKVEGEAFYSRNLAKWLGTSQFAPLNRRCV
jgi:DNA-binding HxlR family transcriptional regulator